MSMNSKVELLTDGQANAGQKRGRAVFKDTLEPQEWEQFRRSLIGMIEKGHLSWEFDLSSMPRCQSMDLGMWVAINATIDNLKGSLVLRIQKDSPVSRLLELTKLDRILTVQAA